MINDGNQSKAACKLQKRGRRTSSHIFKPKPRLGATSDKFYAIAPESSTAKDLALNFHTRHMHRKIDRKKGISLTARLCLCARKLTIFTEHAEQLRMRERALHLCEH